MEQIKFLAPRDLTGRCKIGDKICITYFHNIDKMINGEVKLIPDLNLPLSVQIKSDFISFEWRAKEVAAHDKEIIGKLRGYISDITKGDGFESGYVIIINGDFELLM